MTTLTLHRAVSAFRAISNRPSSLWVAPESIRRSLALAIVLLLLGSASTAIAQPASERFEFTRMVAHWANYGDEGYLPFIEAAEPDLVQLGFYGAHFWSLAHTPQYGGYPAHFPVRGLDECGKWFEDRNATLRKKGVRVVGHFNVEFLVGDPESPDGPRGFFKFYRDHWDEAQLGPRPVKDPVEFLERDADGKPLVNQSYSIGGMKEYWACLRNPHWQQVMKAWVKRGVERGLDGFIANYFYRHNCVCEHCQSGFREHLAGRYTEAQLKSEFDIADLNSHVFDEIVCWHKPQESTLLRREMLRWSQVSNKQVFDEVFVRYGRSLKPDLIVAQWNHLGNFSQINGDERCLLPGELWGVDETYAWYSTGAAANHTDLANNFYGDATLQARYIRGAFDDKPFTLGKYEITRIRAAIAELAANGGAPMGFYTRFTDPAARDVIVQYYQFLKRHDKLFRGNRSHAEVLLLFPRRAVHQGNVEEVQSFLALGKKLLDEHVLFDVMPDDLVDDATRARYLAVLKSSDETVPDSIKSQRSQFTAPAAVRVSASRPAQGGGLTLHFVNYNRDEPPKRKGRPDSGSGIAGEKPLAAQPVGVRFVLPPGAKVASVEFASPETPELQAVKFKIDNGVLEFKTPRFLVYTIANIQLEGEPSLPNRAPEPLRR